MTDPGDPLVAELGQALERIKQLEAQAEADRARQMPPAEQEDGLPPL